LAIPSVQQRVLTGVDDQIRRRPAGDRADRPEPNRAEPPPPGPGQPPPFVLVDQQGQVVIPGLDYRLGQRLSPRDLAGGSPLELNGQVIGTVLSPPALGRDPAEAQYVARIHRALIVATLGATGLALLLAIILARTLTGPLRELTAATQAVAKGHLEQQVPVRTQDELGQLAASFNQMSADLAQANQLRRQMTADIAHELRNPLMVINGYVEGLADGVLQPSAPMFEMMREETQHLQWLVDDLRTLSLADAGELKLNRRPVSPRELLTRVATAHDHLARQQQIELRVEAAANLPDIAVDPDRMTQVLKNLVSNALRYTTAGGHIVLSSQARPNEVRLSVRDNGAGIASEKLAYIFERFYRADEARTQSSGESGLGLAIAKSIVEAHGGTITAESEEGQGTTFIIWLPLQ
ncbi:MAG TPA: ATP-binding protein, partial [Anaerolineae bacterium]|nr:ATP-binding protein [Anaerolineae bacterium]